MRNMLHTFLVWVLVNFLIPATCFGQDSTHVIRVRDITPRGSIVSSLKGKLSFAPHYSVETGAGVAFSYVTGANVTFVGDISSNGYALLGISGAHRMAGDKWKVGYGGYFSSAAVDFWGTGYADASNDFNKVNHDRKRAYVQVEVLRQLSRKFHVGPSVSWDWIDYEKLSGGKTNSLGYGVVAVYDARDREASPQSGIYLKVRQRNYTDFASNPFYASMVQFDAYCHVWENGVLAFDLFGEFAYGNVPWMMLPTVGGTERMRGYYKGRYMDNNAVSAQVELRRHIWEFIGCAAWVGGANVWGRSAAFDFHHTLPNAGLGLRIKMVGGVLLRLDYGFGKAGQNGFVLGLNEAF